jgi:hypothetical protein
MYNLCGAASPVSASVNDNDIGDLCLSVVTANLLPLSVTNDELRANLRDRSASQQEHTAVQWPNEAHSLDISRSE